MSDHEDRNYNTEDGFIVTVGDEVSWDGELRGLMLNAGRAYAKHFSTKAPDLDALKPEQWQAAYLLLKEAVQEDVPFDDDKDFLSALADAT